MITHDKIALIQTTRSLNNSTFLGYRRNISCFYDYTTLCQTQTVLSKALLSPFSKNSQFVLKAIEAKKCNGISISSDDMLYKI